MITCYRFTLTPDHPCQPAAEWAYRLYAALLEQAPTDFAEWVHADSVSPVSQFLEVGETLRWHVTLLGRPAEEALGPVLDTLVPLRLRKGDALLTPTLDGKETVQDVDALFQQAAGADRRHELHFVTPTAFKSRGTYLILPSMRLILQSSIKKWNSCFPDCQIEDEDGQGLEAMAEGILCSRLCLQDDHYRLKRQTIPGFIGTLLLENRLSGFHAQLANVLLLFAGYAGVGIKTTLGMGGVLHSSM